MDPDGAFIPTPPVSWESVFSLTAVFLVIIASFAGGGFWLWRKRQSLASLVAVRQAEAPETVVGVLSLPSTYLAPSQTRGDVAKTGQTTTPVVNKSTNLASTPAPAVMVPKTPTAKTLASGEPAATQKPASVPAEDDIWADTGLENSIYAKLADSYYENPSAAAPSITGTALTGLTAVRSIVKPNAGAFAALKLSQTIAP